MTTVRRVLHPSDFSPASGPAFARALDVARESAAELLVVHVMPPIAPLVGDGYIPPRTFEELERSARTEAQKRVDALVTRATKAAIRAKGLVLEGVPFQEITRAAKSRRADLIVMGTHGRSGLAKLFLGSVAERVIATAPCPVLTVRGR